MNGDVSNTVNGQVAGNVVQARDVHGDVTVGARIVVPAAVEAPTVFGAGAEITVGGRAYLVQAHLAEEGFSPDSTMSFRRARCQGENGHFWLRQVTGGSEDALPAERDLLKALRGKGLPRAEQFDVTGSTTTLVTTWPTSSSGKPCSGLDAWLGPRLQLDSLRLYRLCGGAADLAVTLGGLHERGVAHRGLGPEGVIEQDDGSLVLRDLGLAAHPVERNEHLTPYQAPEQHMRGNGNAGARTDVFQLAAVLYHVIAGRPADAFAPLPLTAWVPVPERLAAVLHAALSVDPAHRPDIRSFGADVLAARADIR